MGLTISEFYSRTGGNYQEVINHLVDEKRVARFLKMFLSDPSCESLEEALEQGNIQEAFRAVHTLKGVCLNMGFSGLFEECSKVTEDLRSGNLEAGMQNMPALRQRYRSIVESIGQLDQV